MKFIVMFNYGYGDEYEEVEVNNVAEAEREAYNLWKEGAENQAVYEVIGEWTQELADDYL